MKEPGIHVDYKSRNLSVKVIIGIAAIIVGAVFFRYEIGLVILAIGGVTVLFGLVSTGNRAIAMLIGVEHWRQERAKTDKLKAEARTAEYVLYSGQQGLVLSSGAEVRYIPPTVSERRQLEDGPIIDGEATEMRSVLQLFQRERCVIIAGPRDAGKTELAKWFVSYRSGLRLVCDPKGIGINRWPGAEVAEDNSSIVAMVEMVARLLEHRRQNGITNGREVNLFIDELVDLVEINQLPIMRPVMRVANLGREFNVHVGFTTNDAGVKTLNIEGQSGFRENFALIKIWRDRLDPGDYRECYLVDGGQKIPLSLPGPFPGGEPPKLFKATLPPPEPNEEERRILEMVASGASYRQITTEIWDGKHGQYYNDIVKEIVRKYGK